MSEEEIARYRSALAEDLIKRDLIHTPAVEQAFRSVPRHLFLPGEPLDIVYSDRVIAIKRDEQGSWTSSSSQPAIMAIMLEQLDLHPGQHVLEIGAGSGFNAALIAWIVGPQGRVITVDIQPDLVQAAQEHLVEAGFGQVQAIAADGGEGYPPGAPYDRIILTVSSSMIPPAWREQLTEGGRLVLPLDIGAGYQKTIAFERRGDMLESLSITDAGFMPLQGAYAAQLPKNIPLDDSDQLFFSSFHRFPADPAALRSWFNMPQPERPAGVRSSVNELMSSFITWLTVHGLSWAQFNATGSSISQEPFPPLFAYSGEHPLKSTLVLPGPDGLAALRRPPGQAVTFEDIEGGGNDFAKIFDLYIRPYGPSLEPSQRLEEALRAWDADGRPGTQRLHIRAFPNDRPYTPRPGEHVLDKPWTSLAIWYE